MRLFELLDRNREAIRTAGLRAISELKAKNVAAHYIDPMVGPGIIEELPDGTRYSLSARRPAARTATSASRR